ncbi:MAG TPA: hypothetical protein VFV95_05670 [Vicinamibacterales bacterium]|nr:hypothetical protein [Vicinamibacterales bacterium]
MTEWVDFSVYAALNVALWFVLPAWSSQFTALYVADRNREWIDSHPEVAKRLLARGWFHWVLAVWGALCLAALLALQVGALPPALATVPANEPAWWALKELNSVLLLPGLLLFFVPALLFQRWLQRTVPLADRRTATLARRSLDDFVPRRVQLAVYVLVGIVVIAWVLVGVMQLYSSAIFWGRFALLVAMTPTFAFFVRLGVNRAPNSLDRVLGPRFRVGEIRYGFAMHLLPPVIGAVRLYEEVMNTALVDINRAMHLGVALIVTGWVLRLTMHSRATSDMGSTGPSFPAPRPSPS